MNKLLISLLLALSVFCMSSAYALDENSDIDVISHISGGAIGGALVAYYLPDTIPTYIKVILGTLTGALLGAAKEGLIDDIWDDTDFAQWAMGGTLGATMITIDF